MSYKPKRLNNDYGDSFYQNSTNNKSYQFEDLYSTSKKNRRKKNSKNIIIPIILVISILCALMGGIMVYGYHTLNSVNYDNLSDVSYNSNIDSELFDDGSNPRINLTNGSLLNDPMILNVLLFGSDSYSAGDGGRTDTILMLSIDNRHKKVKLTSFMRDTWVNIPGYGEQRINVAYTLGGPKLSIETVERNFGIDIDRYAVVDFVGFENIIDRLGGIDIELTLAEVKYINKHTYNVKKLANTAGLIHLTGYQALQHARNRDSAGSDFDRTNRQRQVISCIINKFKDANISQIAGLVADIGPMITTNLKKSEISTLVSNSLTYLNYNIEEYRIPENNNYSDKTINGSMVLVINDINKCRLDLAKFIYEDSIK